MRLFTISILVFFSSAIFAQNFDWTAQNSGVTVLLNDVFFADNQTGWAVGDDGIIVNTTNGGQNWLPQVSGTTEQLRAVFFIDANTGWAVGGTLNKTMIKTTNGGSDWQVASANSIPNSLMLDIEFANINNGWTITIDSIFMTTDGGNTWNTEAFQNTIEVQRCKALSVTSDTTTFVGGSRYLSVTSREASVFYRNTIDMPLAWSISPFNPSTTDDEFISIDFTSAKIGFAGGQDGKLYKKSGTQDTDPWNLNLDISSTGALIIPSISFSNDNNGMFATSNSVLGTINSLIYHTADMGDNWSATPDTIQNLTSPVLYAPDTTNAWVVGFGGKIYKGVPSPLGISEMALDININIYPNPTTDFITIELNSENNELISYSILDITGRLIEEGDWKLNSPNAKFTLNISD